MHLDELELGDFKLDTGTVEKEKEQAEPPKRYHVVLINDPYTPAEFVASVLTKFFRLPSDVAWKVMLDVHQQGKGIIATFPKDIAESKAREATDYSARHEHPLLFVAEPED